MLAGAHHELGAQQRVEAEVGHGPRRVQLLGVAVQHGGEQPGQGPDDRGPGLVGCHGDQFAQQVHAAFRAGTGGGRYEGGETGGGQGGQQSAGAAPTVAADARHVGARPEQAAGVGPAGRQRAVLRGEREPGARKDAVLDALRAALRDHRHGRRIGTVLFHPRFPTTIRHNSRIYRARLAACAAKYGSGGAR
ncbi:hypothetical protein PV963_40770 [Streptomyces coeruleorubidus]|nr:hypothetical protein [Streptomyces coeruleorubidus]WDV56226.1 hypothetical protein PV963_40770 [Streptomyces coeruleorubidus]